MFYVHFSLTKLLLLLQTIYSGEKICLGFTTLPERVIVRGSGEDVACKGICWIPDVLVLFHCHCVRFVLYLRIGLPLYQL